ncbi:hypothetical protein AVEN_14416-1 [Araneus ventricosus]|uniref:Uncharacterized protein n=1 Tax=Araneus ventricosus TaxID=182803 RepID=A0A4Y2TER3_ARAVE|nr:hypothetical protein AVEN_14416-1 [Araneus ventricosus]
MFGVELEEYLTANDDAMILSGGPDIGRFRDLASTNHSHTISEAAEGSRLWCRRVPGSRPDFIEDLRYMGPVARQIIRSGQTWCGVEV